MVGVAPCVRKTVRGALTAPDRKTDPSQSAFYSGVMRNKSLRILQPLEQLTSLSLYHDSQFSAFSTEVLVRKNRDTIAVVLPVLP